MLSVINWTLVGIKGGNTVPLSSDSQQLVYHSDRQALVYSMILS